jgi:hypothetical protein
VAAAFTEVAPVLGDDACAVRLCFRPTRTRPFVERIDDIADLGPPLTVETVRGIGKVIRLLRASRLAGPEDPRELIGRAKEVAALLERALGVSVVLRVQPRSRIRFLAWTEHGVERIEDVAEVREDADAYLVLRQSGRLPVRLPRASVVRTRTDCETWYEVLSIERSE